MPLESAAAGAQRYKTRAATPADASAIAAIYNQGIADRVATFETERRSLEDIAAWFTPGRLIMMAEDAQRVVAFAGHGRHVVIDAGAMAMLAA